MSDREDPAQPAEPEIDQDGEPATDDSQERDIEEKLRHTHSDLASANILISKSRLSRLIDSDELADSSFVFTPRPGGGFDIEQHKAEQSAARALRKHQFEVAEAKHRRTEETKRSDQRLFFERVMFLGVVVVLSVILVFSLAVALLSENDNRQQWAQSIVVLIIGGVVGGLAGYITGQSGK